MDPATIALAFTAIVKLIVTYAMIVLAVWLVAELCKGVSAEEASEAYTLMRFESYDPKERKLLIQVVDSKVYELLESKYSKPFTASIKKYFGSITLKYRVMNKNS